MRPLSPLTCSNGPREKPDHIGASYREGGNGSSFNVSEKKATENRTYGPTNHETRGVDVQGNKITCFSGFSFEQEIFSDGHGPSPDSMSTKSGKSAT